MSKYASVDEAVKWSVGLLKVLLYTELGHWTDWADSAESRKNFLHNFAEKLETILVKEIDNKIKENSGIRQRIHNLLDSHSDEYKRVNLIKAINKTLVELKLSPLPEYAVNESYVTPTCFIGRSFLSKYYKNAEYDFQQPKKMLNTKIKQKPEIVR